MISYKYYGSLKISNTLPSFVLPLFSCGNENSLYAQYFNIEEKIEKMLIVPNYYFEKYEIVLKNLLGEVEIGGESLYAFASSSTEGLLKNKKSVQIFLEKNIDNIFSNPRSKLEVLNFIDANYEEKFSTIKELSLLIENDNVRNKFLEIEKSLFVKMKTI